jgi:uncharacterized membrane protein
MAFAELRGQWKNAIFAYVLYIALLTLPAALLNILFGAGMSVPFYMGANGFELNYELFDINSDAFAKQQAGASVSLLYRLIIEGPLLLGFSGFLLALVRGAKIGLGMILDGFNNFFRAVGLFILIFLLIFVGILLICIAGGISLLLLPNFPSVLPTSALGVFSGSRIALILIVWFFAIFAVVAVILLRCSQAFFLLVDEPRCGAGLALRRSGMMMSGNKRKLFLLVISFAGWFILSYIVVVILSYLFSFAPAAMVLFLLPVLNGAVMAPAYMYMMAACAVFYDILTGRRRLLPVGEGFPADADGSAGEIPPRDSVDVDSDARASGDGDI